MIKPKSLFRILCFLFLLFNLVACSKQATLSEKPTAPSGVTSYLALGDSYTIGESVAIGDRWPVQLVNALNQNGHVTANPTIVATTGWTTDELSSTMDRVRLAGPFDLVSLLIGVNNQYRGRDVENFKKEYTRLLERAIALAGGDQNRVFVVSIPDWGVMPFAEDRDQGQIAQEIDAYNAAKKKITQKMGVVFIDITPISREASTDLDLVASDGLHPSGKMYSRWVQEEILQVVGELIK